MAEQLGNAGGKKHLKIAGELIYRDAWFEDGGSAGVF